MKPLCIRGIADHENTKMKGKEVWAVIGDTEFGPTLYLTESEDQAYKEACEYIENQLMGYEEQWPDSDVLEDVRGFRQLLSEKRYEEAYHIAINMDNAYEELGDNMWTVAEEEIH